MQAKIKSVRRCRIAGALMIVTNVDFVDASGYVVHSQEYGHLPADLDPDYFQRQADTMQADLEQAAKAAADAATVAKEEAEADAAIARMTHKLQFNDEVTIYDRRT